MAALAAVAGGRDAASAALLQAASEAVASYSAAQGALGERLQAQADSVSRREADLPRLLAALEALGDGLGAEQAEQPRTGGDGRRRLAQAPASGANNGVAALVASVAQDLAQRGMSTDEGRELQMQVSPRIGRMG